MSEIISMGPSSAPTQISVFGASFFKWGMRNLLILVFAGLGARAGAVPADQWKQNFIEGFSKMACHSDGPWTSCYSVTVDDCEKRLKKSIQNCMKTTRVPASVSLISEGPGLGALIGECASKDFERALQSKKKRDGVCR